MDRLPLFSFLRYSNKRRKDLRSMSPFLQCLSSPLPSDLKEKAANLSHYPNFRSVHHLTPHDLTKDWEHLETKLAFASTLQSATNYPAKGNPEWPFKVVHCLPLLTEKCLTSSVVAVKTIRYPLEFLPLLDRAVDKVVLLVRDPRGIINSRNRKQAAVTPRLTEQVQSLCQRLKTDYESTQKYNTSFPIYVLRYEDFASAPHATAAAVYDFCGVSRGNGVMEALMELTHAEKDDGMFSTQRQNSTATAFAWIGEILDEVVQVVNTNCKEALDYFDYRAHY
jgi:hypothetical protein